MYKKHLSVLIIFLFLSISFNPSIIAKEIDEESEEPLYELKMNYFNEENTIYVTNDTLNEISDIIYETREKFSGDTDFSDGLTIIIDAVKDLKNLGLFQNKSIDTIRTKFNEQINDLEYKDETMMIEHNDYDSLNNYSIKRFSYVSGEVKTALFCSIFPIIALLLFHYEMFNFYYPLLSFALLPIGLFYYLLSLSEMLLIGTDILILMPILFMILKSKIIPIHFFNFLDLGWVAGVWNRGWVSTLDRKSVV